MPVIDIQANGPELSATEVAGALVTHVRDPLKSSEFVRGLNQILSPLGLFVGRRLMTAQDLALRLGVPLSVAKRALNINGDVQVGRRWTMTEERFNECVRLRRFKTQ